MYYTGLDPFTLEPLFVEKDPARRERQKQIVVVKAVQPTPSARTLRPGRIGRKAKP
jgi:hypothetical protein